MIKQINDWIALNLTIATGTMWCVYLFAFIALIPLGIPSLEPLSMYISTTILQLILLPLIICGQNLISQKSETRAEQDHLAVMEIVQDIHGMMSDETEENSQLQDILARLTAIETVLTKS